MLQIYSLTRRRLAPVKTTPRACNFHGRRRRRYWFSLCRRSPRGAGFRLLICIAGGLRRRVLLASRRCCR